MSSSQRAPAAPPQTASVTPYFPLILLETMRDMDRPEEVLEGENLAVSLPRRLGLSDVVYTQIHRFGEESRKGRLQTPAVVEDLVRLVIRRPDAEEIFEEAGRRVARRFWTERSAAARLAVRVLPNALALRSAARAAERVFRRVSGGAELRVQRNPLSVRLERCLTARADPGGAACAFYGGVLAEVMEQYTGRQHGVDHARCEARADPACEWAALVTG
jgi:predicted hydrocarbon binding protein